MKGVSELIACKAIPHSREIGHFDLPCLREVASLTQGLPLKKSTRQARDEPAEFELKQ